MIRRALIVGVSLLTLVIPTQFSAAQQEPYQYKRQGIFDCAGGEYANSVGARAATQGAYVPVNDAAVTINTYQLLYKECVLIELVARQREATTAGMLANGTRYFTTGRNGEPMWPRDLKKDRLEKSGEAFIRVLQSPLFDSINPAFSDEVKRAAARGYRSAAYYAADPLVCPYEGDLSKSLAGRGDRTIWESFTAYTNPACVQFTVQLMAEDLAYNEAASDVRDLELELQRNGGIYDAKIKGPDGRDLVVTPGSIIGSNYQQLLQTGFKQLENSNDIGQMVGALFSGITAHVLGDTRGLLGLTQSTGGQPSYLDQVVRDSALGLRTVATNAALQILSNARQVESVFNQVIRAILEVLIRAKDTIFAQENRCYELIIQHVCTSAPVGNKCSDGTNNYEISTSTYAYAQKVYDSQIQPLASSTAEQLIESDSALDKLSQLIQSISGNPSIEAQRIAIQQLDTLIAERRLHTEFDLRAAQKSQQDTTSAMATLIENTAEAWGDSPDRTVGWCNVNNSEVIEDWKARWRK